MMMRIKRKPNDDISRLQYRIEQLIDENERLEFALKNSTNGHDEVIAYLKRTVEDQDHQVRTSFANIYSTTSTLRYKSVPN